MKKVALPLAIVMLVLAAVAIRMLYINVHSNDFLAFQPYYDSLKTVGFKAFGDRLSIYPPLYLYGLYIETKLFPAISDELAIKLPSILCDLLLAGFVALLVWQKRKNYWMSILSAAVVLFLPTVILNSAYWGQFDSIYACLMMAGVYCLTRGKKSAAMLLIGLAFSVKLQTVFIFPFLAILVLRKELSIKHVLLIPLVYLISIIPAWMAGRSLTELLTIYLFQTNAPARLTMHAPNPYAWLPESEFQALILPGIAAGVAFTASFIWMGTKHQRTLNKTAFIQLALLSLILVPLVFPKMHERYFYPAEIMAVVYAFYQPKYFYIPALLVFTSFCAYQPFLFHVDIVDMGILAIVMVITFILVVYQYFVGPGKEKETCDTA